MEEGEVEMKEWMCVQVKHHNDVANTIERFQKNGWHLHTYQTGGLAVYHYLLFEKGK